MRAWVPGVATASCRTTGRVWASLLNHYTYVQVWPKPSRGTFSLGSGYRLGVGDLPRVTNILAVSPLASPSPFLGKGHQLNQTQGPLRAGVGPLPKESMTFEVNVEIWWFHVNFFLSSYDDSVINGSFFLPNQICYIIYIWKNLWSTVYPKAFIEPLERKLQS